jgi:drug/metabolite transporter (DMT)-like permease
MLIGIGLKLVSTLAFTFMSACVKLVGAAHPHDPLYYTVSQTVFFRSLFALIPVFLWLGWRGDLHAAFENARLRTHLRRGFFGSIGMFSGFTALILLPLADATAFSYAAPLFTVVLAALILKEVVRVYRWTAVGLGFVGVIVMLVPYFGAGGPGGDQRAVGAFFGVLGADDRDAQADAHREHRRDRLLLHADHDRALPDREPRRLLRSDACLAGAQPL